jgi:hypothetical protein
LSARKQMGHVRNAEERSDAQGKKAENGDDLPKNL